jgi:hypothetical protein
MPDVDWGDFTDTGYLLDTDVLVLARAGAGINAPGSTFLKRAANGNFGADVVTPLEKLHVTGVVYSYDNGRAGFRVYNGGSTTEWFVGQESGTSHSLKFQAVGGGSYFDKLTLDMTGNLYSGLDNATNALGLPFARWTTVFAGTGTINTSDEREKAWRGELTAAELRAARRIAREIGGYQWLAAVAEKGEDGARLHIGVRAQRVFAIMNEEGLDWRRYAWCCHDAWEAVPAIAPRPAVLDDAGNVVTPAMPGRAAQPAGDRCGIRPDQLAFFLIAAQERRLAALEDAADA